MIRAARKAPVLSRAPAPKKVLIMPLPPEKRGRRIAAGKQAHHKDQAAGQEHGPAGQGLARSAALGQTAGKTHKDAAGHGVNRPLLYPAGSAPFHGEVEATA